MPNATATLEPRPPSTYVGDHDRLAEFTAVRSRLIGIAGRVLGRPTDAEDVVQDAWLRWQGYDRDRVVDPTAFLVTTTTRLAINATQSARSRRELAMGDRVARWSRTQDDPTSSPELLEELSAAMSLLVERLSPAERAAYVLRQAFDHSYPRIAEILRISEANARQLVSRAGKRLAAAPPGPPGRAEHGRLVRTFVAAARSGDLTALEELLAADVVRRHESGRPPPVSQDATVPCPRKRT